jgi:hypothetical protein
MIKYKLTTQQMTTHTGCQWVIGVPKETTGEGELCGPGWLHYYDHPLLAVLLNSIHADIDNPRLWEAECEGQHLDDHGLKGGCTKMTLLREIPMPKVTINQRTAFAILCTKEVRTDKDWNEWADNWLSSKDRSEKTIEKTTREAWKTAADAAWSVTVGQSAARAAKSKPINLIKIAEEAMKY